MISYRPYRESDLPGVLDLWRSETDWGAPDPDQWRQWFEQTPHGPAVIVVACDSTEGVVGQIAFTPARLRVEGRNVSALRVSAPILRRSGRQPSIKDHPAGQLFVAGMREAAARGFEVVYALPDMPWRPALRLLRDQFAATEFPCCALPLDGDYDTAARSTVTAQPIDTLGREHAEIWDAAMDSFGIRCAIHRSAEWLRWRHGEDAKVEARDDDGTLKGYVTIRRRDGLITDLIATTPDALIDVVGATAQKLRGSGRGILGPQVGALKALRTDVLGPALDAVGFQPDPYRFLFVVAPIGSQAGFPPEHWHIAPGD